METQIWQKRKARLKKPSTVDISKPSIPNAIRSSGGKFFSTLFSISASAAKDEKNVMKRKINAIRATDQVITDLKFILSSCL
jgi:hypothetical protein